MLVVWYGVDGDVGGPIFLVGDDRLFPRVVSTRGNLPGEFVPLAPAGRGSMWWTAFLMGFDRCLAFCIPHHTTVGIPPYGAA